MLRVHDPFRRGQLATAALFCSLGFQYATWASRLPAIKSHLGLTAAEVGLLLMATGIGAVAAFPLVAVLMRRLGSRRLALGSALCLALLLLAMSALPDYPVALLVMLCDGALVAALNVAMNAQGAALEAVHERNAMARLHATFSGGSLAAALLASGMNALTSTLIAHFAVATVLLLLLVGSARTGLLTEDRRAEEKKEKGRGRWTMPSRVTLWLGAAMVFGTVTEGAMNDWSALYMKDVAKASAELAPMGIAVVSVMMVLARVFADSWRSRWGDGRIVRIGSALAGAGLALALLSGGVVPALIGFACVGLGIASVTPCVYVAAAKNGSDALTVVATMGTTGLLAGPPVIGFIANASGLVWALGAVAAAAMLVAVCSTRIRWTPVEAVPAEA
ncbi:Predicted arabinose efflux permease, MFS family [Actinacidiphila yanglinensis]|uniref:Predicted arabinose efflux permease, MFS family n=1 Tax=Actinacidiphila yanglinensis TaxID=310779 RepID=A0A1H5XXR1_9ACTN|nr:MFS transporter [Actinacidiphila yanglinensis]SEG16491.1 Predicted arabinose efflux permease, MFS family [Actinacidiphila yanglinensis]